MGSVGSGYRNDETNDKEKKGSIRDVAYENMTEDSEKPPKKASRPTTLEPITFTDIYRLRAMLNKEHLSSEEVKTIKDMYVELKSRRNAGEFKFELNDLAKRIKRL